MDKTNFGLEVDFLIRPHQGWAPQPNERRVGKMAAPTPKHTQVGRKAHVRKMGTQTKNVDRPKATNLKTSTQGSTRLKDELEDG
jgi:hypothetical protein